jgi:uncharacterized OsmC-like protein
MAEVKLKTVVDMSLKGTVESHARTRVATRDVSTVIDEPAVRGGTNMGLTPTDTLMAALIGCTNVISQRIAHNKGVEPADLTIDVKAQFDRRGVSLEEAIAVPFPQITLTITGRSNATPAQLEEIKEDLTKFCLLSVVIRAAGTRIDEVWNISQM